MVFFGDKFGFSLYHFPWSNCAEYGRRWGWGEQWLPHWVGDSVNIRVFFTFFWVQQGARILIYRIMIQFRFPSEAKIACHPPSDFIRVVDFWIRWFGDAHIDPLSSGAIFDIHPDQVDLHECYNTFVCFHFTWWPAFDSFREVAPTCASPFFWLASAVCSRPSLLWNPNSRFVWTNWPQPQVKLHQKSQDVS